METERGRRLEVKVISEKEAMGLLEETHDDPESARIFFEEYMAQRQRALERFLEEVHEDRELAEELRSNPIATLERRQLLAGTRSLIAGIPWLFPPCYLRPEFDCKSQWVWVTVNLYGTSFTYPCLQITCTLKTVLVCGEFEAVIDEWELKSKC